MPPVLKSGLLLLVNSTAQPCLLYKLFFSPQPLWNLPIPPDTHISQRSKGSLFPSLASCRDRAVLCFASDNWCVMLSNFPGRCSRRPPGSIPSSSYSMWFCLWNKLLSVNPQLLSFQIQFLPPAHEVPVISDPSSTAPLEENVKTLSGAIDSSSPWMERRLI